MTGPILAPSVRERLNAAYARMVTAIERPFVGSDGLLAFGVPKAVLKAWLLAGHLGGDLAEACGRAWFGDAALGEGGKACARAWAKRLAVLDRMTREGEAHG